jgi:hypothetical protein
VQNALLLVMWNERKVSSLFIPHGKACKLLSLYNIWFIEALFGKKEITTEKFFNLN